jgi:hypothetical protein
MLAIVVLQEPVTTAEQAHPIDFDLQSIKILKPCSPEPSPTDDTEILVCGRRDANGRYRLTNPTDERKRPLWAILRALPKQSKRSLRQG